MPFNRWLNTVTLKWIMALSGLFLVGFVIAHMLGNLQIFLGRDAINEYARLLKSNAALLWGFRLALLAAAVLHVSAAIALIRINRAAAGSRYSVRDPLSASIASRTMALSGIVLLAFIVYHILHFTVMAFHPEYHALDSQGRHDVYGMMVAGFSQPLIASFYILSMALLALHLSHGIGSIFRTVGFASKRIFIIGSAIGYMVAAVLFLGFVSVPVSVWIGWVK
ncbi:MAG: succinate dehydrogenase cytochrome b subunit [Methylacidiphilales bacterium]|nr:succinate dehydrogenase cytochrome b subunit [Candidatus Methylacidiphilales bacterium]MDW8350012.1 succinate dehydrogenase cytochrome b subunit [Verrucomicrobiae bacterium]